MSPERKYLVTILDEGNIKIVESLDKPLLGGYKSMKKYGNPDYCPSATRHHKKAKEETGRMSNLVFFDSVETAVASGYSPCGNCWIKGEMATIRWQEYTDACDKFKITPGLEPVIIRKK